MTGSLLVIVNVFIVTRIIMIILMLTIKNIFKKTIKTKMKTITEVTKINKRTVMTTRAINTTI